MRSSRLQAKAEALGSIGYKSRVEVDDGSTGGCRLEAFSRATHSRADQRLPIVELATAMGSVVDARTGSGACCTFPRGKMRCALLPIFFTEGCSPCRASA